MANARKISVGSSALGYGLTGLLLVFGSIAGSKALAETAPPVVLQYWASGSPKLRVLGPWWVPSSLLNKPYTEWDGENQLKISAEKLKEVKVVADGASSRGRSGKCVPAPDGLVSVAGGGDRVSVQEAAAHAGIVINARVISVEPGWDFASNMVSSLVRARVEGVVKGADLESGQEIMYLRPWGVLKYGNTILCTSVGHSGPASDLEGESFDSNDLNVLVIGRRMSDSNKFLIETTAAGEFKIVQGRFVSTAGFKLVEPADFSLEDLIQSLEGN